MGCSTSKLDNEELVQLCKDRRNFIKQAVEYRTQFASAHIVYIRSLKRVSAALREYIDEPREFSLDSFVTPPLTPVKKSTESKTTLKVNYCSPCGNPAVSVEERPQSAETVRVEIYSPVHHYGIDNLFAMQSPPPTTYSVSSPQASHWDFFWDPFSSLDYYSYQNRISLGQTTVDDAIEDRIPDREEEVIVEDVDGGDGDVEEKDHGTKTEHVSKGFQNSRQVEGANQQKAVGDQEAMDETPGFTVHVNRRPTSMTEVLTDLEDQFTAVCNSAKEISALLETSRAHYSSTSSELSAMKILNPVALIRSASSLSVSSRLLLNSCSKEESCDSTSDFSEECISDSHQSTLDKLLVWEKKLYQEVKSGEKLRIAYIKKCKQLGNLDVNGADPSAVDKTRTAIRDLYTKISVSMHTVEAISKRIETLRDKELQPQLFELVQGLLRMWKAMAECHQLQKRTLDEAKLLLTGTPTKQNIRHSGTSFTEPQRLARLAANLETELRNWRTCFESWIISQRSYVHALAGWLLKCVQWDPDASKLPFSPCRSSGTLPIIGLCIQWSRCLDDTREVPVLDGLDFFAAGVGSLYAQQLREDSRVESKRYEHGSNMEVVEFNHVDEVSMSVEKMAEVAIRVVCAGMSVAIRSLAEFAIGSAEGYDMLVKQCENVTWPPSEA